MDLLAEGAGKIVSPLARQAIDSTLGPLVKKIKPTTARDLIPNARGGPLAQQVIDTIEQKPLKLAREKVPTDPALAQPVGDLLGAARNTAQPLPPTPMEQLLGAAQGTVSAPAKAAIKKTNAAKGAANVLAPVAPSTPPGATEALSQVSQDPGNLLGLLSATYGGDRWRKALGNLTGGLDYLDRNGRLTGTAGDATDILNEYLTARPTLKLAKDDKALKAIAARMRATLWGEGGATPAEIAAHRQAVRKDVFGITDPQQAQLMQAVGDMFRANPVRGGAGIGGVVGGATAQDSNGDGNVDPGERLRAALEGALVGGATGGVTNIPGGVAKDLAVLGHTAGKAEMQRALKEGKLSFKALAGDWSKDKIVTPRNALLDEITNRVRALMGHIPQGTINAATGDIASRKRLALAAVQGATTPEEIAAAQAQAKLSSISSNLEGMLRANGIDPATFDPHLQLGQAFHDTALGQTGKGDILHPLASAGAGGMYSLLDPTTYLTSGVGAGVGVLRGAARPYTSEAFHAVNDVQHLAARNPAFEIEAQRLLDELAPQLLDQLKAGGYDVSKLAPHGAFSPTDLVNLGAGNEAEVWQQVLAQIYGHGDQPGLASKFVKATFGDYHGDPNGVVKAFGKIAPFSRYALGQAPVLAKAIAENPAAALMVANLLYKTGGKIPIPADTPVLGGLVNQELGGAPGEGSVSPASLVAPVPASAGSVGDNLDKAQNPYQQAQAIMGAAGFQFNPLITTAMYILGPDKFGPGTQSRFAGAEQGLGGPQVPTIKTPLDNARKAISGQFPGGGDPVQTRLNEIVLRTTGKPLDAPENHALAVRLQQDPNDPLWQQARDEALHGNAAKSIASGILPLTVSAKTDVKAQGDQAKKGIPFTPEDIKAAQDAGNQVMVQTMQAVNQQYKQQNPAAAVNDKPALSAREKQDVRLTQWDDAHRGLSLVNPSVFAALRAQFKKDMGIN